MGLQRKGYSYAAQAVERIQTRMEKKPMLITMGNPKKMDQKYPLEKSKHFGYIKDPTKQALMYAAADIFICSTLADGQPQTAIESLACGTPVIAFNIGPMPELVQDGKTGFIAPEVTVESLVTTLERALEDPEHLVEMRRYCRDEAENKYDLTKQTIKYIDLYAKIMTENTGIISR
jgi:glycosyltransferase involved in cell wall biosynthesis